MAYCPWQCILFHLSLALATFRSSISCIQSVPLHPFQVGHRHCTIRRDRPRGIGLSLDRETPIAGNAVAHARLDSKKPNPAPSNKLQPLQGDRKGFVNPVPAGLKNIQITHGVIQGGAYLLGRHRQGPDHIGDHHLRFHPKATHPLAPCRGKPDLPLLSTPGCC